VVQQSEYLDRDSNDRVYRNDVVSDAHLTSSKQNEHAEVYLSEGQETAKSVKLESNPEPEEDKSEAYSSDHDQSQQQVKAEAVERQIHSEEETV